MHPLLHSILILSPIMALGLTVAGWQRRTRPGMKILMGIGLMVAFWGAAYYFEVAGGDLPTKLLWAQLKNIVVPFVPLMASVLFLRMAGIRYWPWPGTAAGYSGARYSAGYSGAVLSAVLRPVLRPRLTRALALLVIPVLYILAVYTNELHGLLWPTVKMVQYTGYSTLEMTTGPMYYLLAVFSYGMLFFSMAVSYARISRFQYISQRSIRLVLLVVVIVIVFGILSMLKLFIFPGIDPSPLVFGLSGLVMLVISWHPKSRYFGLTNLAHMELFDQMREGVIFMDINLRILDINRAAQTMLGVQKEQVLNRPIDSLGEDAAKFLRSQASLGTAPIETPINSPQGTRWFETRLTPLIDEENDQFGYIAVWHEVTDRKQVEKELQYSSTHDALTGLYNRLFFEEEFERVRLGRQWPVTILMIDIDHLKYFNDTFGHLLGDALIRQTGQVFKNALRQGDMVARIGGDEFVALLPGCGQPCVVSMLERISQHVAAHNAEHPELPIRFSLGNAVADYAGELDEALRRADASMYTDKGKKDVELYPAHGVVGAVLSPAVPGGSPAVPCGVPRGRFRRKK